MKRKSVDGVNYPGSPPQKPGRQSAQDAGFSAVSMQNIRLFTAKITINSTKRDQVVKRVDSTP